MLPKGAVTTALCTLAGTAACVVLYRLYAICGITCSSFTRPRPMTTRPSPCAASCLRRSAGPPPLFLPASQLSTAFESIDHQGSTLLFLSTLSSSSILGGNEQRTGRGNTETYDSQNPPFLPYFFAALAAGCCSSPSQEDACGSVASRVVARRPLVSLLLALLAPSSWCCCFDF